MPQEKITLNPRPEDAGTRLDQYAAEECGPERSRSFIQKLIKEGCVRVNGEEAKANYRMNAGDTVDIVIPEVVKCETEPRDIPLEILYEDGDIAVINKQPGITVHPGAGTHGDTLVSALLYHLDDLSSIGGVERPGIVHRLDRDTAGIMVIAKNDIAHRSLSEQFSGRTIQKEYTAIVRGKPRADHFIVDKPIGRHKTQRHKMAVDPSGRDALSEFFLQKVWNGRLGTYSLLRVTIHTGRTHQIRVHLSASGHPIAGDTLYSRHKTDLPFLMLASVRLAFTHPATKKLMEFRIPLPPHMQQFIDKLDAAE
jgi:23S rRNA pseudouridine1911/1915/1917 synthase